jgi:hypothetical protein
VKQAPLPVLLATGIALGLSVAALCWMWDPWPAIQTLAAVLTVTIVWWYTFETKALRGIAAEQVKETRAQSRAVYRPYLELEAVSTRLDLINHGLGAALEVSITWPAMTHPGHDGMGSASPIFDRVPIVPPGKGISVAARLEWEAETGGTMAPEVDFELLTRRTRFGEPFEVVLRYRDLGLFEYAVTHRFQNGRARSVPLPALAPAQTGDK